MNTSLKENKIILENINFLKKILQRKIGVDLSGYKEDFIRRRIYARMLTYGITDINQYLNLLEKNNEEKRKLLDALDINVSQFFRDFFVWKIVKERVVKELVEHMVKRKVSIKIWSAGCAHGQEPYSIAMLVVEVCKELNVNPLVKIYATDIDDDALKKAKLGFYNHQEVKDVPYFLLKEYFQHEDGGCWIKDNIRNLVFFRKHDLIKDPPLLFVNTIFCRNVFIYFDRENQNKILSKFYQCLYKPAYLILGASENLWSEGNNLFEIVDNRAKIYRKKLDSNKFTNVF